MKKILFLLFIIFFAGSKASIFDGTFEEEDGVALLSHLKFGMFKYRSPFMVSYFYNLTLPFAQELSQEVAKAARELANFSSGIKFGKIDLVTNETMKNANNITEEYAILLYIRGAREGIKYSGERTAEGIVGWVMEQLKKSVSSVSTPEEYEAVMKKKEDVAFYFGSYESQEYLAFLSALSTFNDYTLIFASTDDASLRRENGAADQNTLVLFRNFTEERTVFSQRWTVDNIAKFIKIYKYATVMAYDRKTRSRIQMNQEDTLILFKRDDDSAEQEEKIFQSLAKDLRGEMIFAIDNFNPDPFQSFGGSLLRYFGLKETDLPRVAILQGGKEMKKFLFSREINEKNLLQFIQNYREGNLKPFRRSEPIPEKSYDGDIQVVVGSTFKQIVLDESKDVLIAFYSPDCPYSKAFFKTYVKVAALFKDYEDLVFAKVNNDMNEFEDFEMLNVPRLMLFAKGKKQKPVQVTQPALGVLVKSLKKHTKLEIPENFEQQLTKKRNENLESFRFDEF